MQTLKTIIKMIAGLLGGIIIGLLIAGAGLAIFTDISFSQFLDNMSGASLKSGLIGMGIGVGTLVITLPLLVMIHEAGHLVGGLLSGYSFVSFRIFNLTFIRIEGKTRIKRFAVAGTGGQCLLTPPDLPIERIPTMLYNLGGVFANLLVLLIAVPVLFLDLNPIVRSFIVLLVITDAILLATNGIPLKIGGITNDAYNQILLHKSPASKRGLVLQLRSNALIQDGTRPKDMPDEWFDVPEHIDYGNALEASLPIMAASRLIDMYRWEEAYQYFSDILGHRKEIMGLYVNEILCEMVFLPLVTGRKEEAQSLLTKDIEKYINTYRKVMSSKERILGAIDYYMKEDTAGAKAIYDNLLSRKDEYLLQGEVKSDIAILDKILNH